MIFVITPIIYYKDYNNRNPVFVEGKKGKGSIYMYETCTKIPSVKTERHSVKQTMMILSVCVNTSEATQG